MAVSESSRILTGTSRIKPRTRGALSFHQDFNIEKRKSASADGITKREFKTLAFLTERGSSVWRVATEEADRSTVMSFYQSSCLSPYSLPHPLPYSLPSLHVQTILFQTLKSVSKYHHALASNLGSLPDRSRSSD